MGLDVTGFVITKAWRDEYTYRTTGSKFRTCTCELCPNLYQSLIRGNDPNTAVHTLSEFDSNGAREIVHHDSYQHAIEHSLL
jgi:glutamine synthetase adenylyltransferase